MTPKKQLFKDIVNLAESWDFPKQGYFWGSRAEDGGIFLSLPKLQPRAETLLTNEEAWFIPVASYKQGWPEKDQSGFNRLV